MVKATNKLIVGNLRKNLEEKMGSWFEELSKVFLTQRTTKKRSTNDSPFALVFRIEVVLPMKASVPTTLVVENAKEDQR